MKEIECSCGIIFEGEDGDKKCEWCVQRHMDALRKKDGYEGLWKPTKKEIV